MVRDVLRVLVLEVPARPVQVLAVLVLLLHGRLLQLRLLQDQRRQQTHRQIPVILVLERLYRDQPPQVATALPHRLPLLEAEEVDESACQVGIGEVVAPLDDMREVVGRGLLAEGRGCCFEGGDESATPVLEGEGEVRGEFEMQVIFLIIRADFLFLVDF